MAIWHILIVMIVALGLMMIAEKRGIQPPLLLAAVGVAVSFIPGLPHARIDSDLILRLVVPPLIYSAAADFSLFSFLKRLTSIINLGVVLVLVTAAGAAAIALSSFPGLAVPVALAMGAVLAPPDPVSAISIGRRLGLPARLMTVLKGESLINDAAALTLFTVSLAAATGRHNLIDNPVLYFIYASAVGIATGIGMALIVHLIRKRLTDAPMITALAFITPFAVYSLAEALHASGIVAVVFAGFTLGHRAGEVNFAGRIQEREVWRVTDALLEAFVFAYIGLQFRWVLQDAIHSGYGLHHMLVAGGLILGGIILIRMAWVMVSSQFAHLLPHRHGEALGGTLGWKENLVLGWSGMRGVITLAAAASMPVLDASGVIVPGHTIVLPLAFGVVIGTLLLQGMSLPWLIRILNIQNDDESRFRREQVAHAREVIQATTERKLAHLRDGDSDVSKREAQRTAKWLEAIQRQTDPGVVDPQEMARIFDIANQVLAAQREALIEERDRNDLNDEILRGVLEDIDVEQAVIAARDERLSDI